MVSWLLGSGKPWMRRVFGCGLQPLRRLTLAASFSPTLSDARPPPLADSPTVPLVRSLSRGLQWQPAGNAHITGGALRSAHSRQLAQAARQRVPAPPLGACGQPCLIRCIPVVATAMMRLEILRLSCFCAGYVGTKRITLYYVKPLLYQIFIVLGLQHNRPLCDIAAKITPAGVNHPHHPP